MLYNAENSITPKLKLNDIDRNVSLSWMRKSRFPGNWRMMMSTHITEAPTMQATPLSIVITHPRSSLERTMLLIAQM